MTENPASRPADSRSPLPIIIFSAVVCGAVVLTALTVLPVIRPDSMVTAVIAGAVVLTLGTGVTGALCLAAAATRSRDRHAAADLARAEVTERRREDERARQRLAESLTKAVDQLGSERAAVRTGAMCALERLAQDHPDHRQTIINILCGYLRMPFDPSLKSQGHELQVRLTAQRILTEHLQPFHLSDILRLVGKPQDLSGFVETERRDLEITSAGEPTNPRFWADVSLDLTGACLIDFDFYRCRAATAVFSKAAFHGDTRFLKCRVTGPAQFDDAAFHGPVWFDSAQLAGSGLFRDAVFHRRTRFDAAQLHNALFERTRFLGDVSFNVTQFVGDFVTFEGAVFAASVGFPSAGFHADARFDKAVFDEDTDLDSAVFHAESSFVGAKIRVLPPRATLEDSSARVISPIT